MYPQHPTYPTMYTPMVHPNLGGVYPPPQLMQMPCTTSMHRQPHGQFTAPQTYLPNLNTVTQQRLVPPHLATLATESHAAATAQPTQTLQHVPHREAPIRTDTAPILAATNNHAAATAQSTQTPRHVPHREAPMRTDTAPIQATTNNHAAATAQPTQTLQHVLHREAPMSTDTAPILAATNNQAEIQTQNTSHQIMPNIAPATSKDTHCRNGEYTDDHMQHPKGRGSPKKLGMTQV
ncbi:hypothetical protein DPMN_114810 [Dreissena polymorpha]|uniref:Uncharacterized protein n=1 Tax=Dreissena polymorpha TaxID=45954 RepID=A0A9D4QRX5_DREPO|nr:hypothetical protein DPMN_114810 [Dreissena polymorpha]